MPTGCLIESNRIGLLHFERNELNMEEARNLGLSSLKCIFYFFSIFSMNAQDGSTATRNEMQWAYERWEIFHFIGSWRDITAHHILFLHLSSIELNIDTFKRKLYIKFNFWWCADSNIILYTCQCTYRDWADVWPKQMKEPESFLRNRAPVCCSAPSINEVNALLKCMRGK